MPTYVNNSSIPIYFNDVVFIPNQEVETYHILPNRAFVVGTVVQNYDITESNNVLRIRFNEEIDWTIVSLTLGGARTAAQIVTDINIAYGFVVASVDGGRIRIDAPIKSNVISSIYIDTAEMGSTAAATLGLPTNNVNPVDCVALQAFVFSQNPGTYNITNDNNTFIFKINDNSSWITARLTTGNGRTAVQIANDINLAYQMSTATSNRVAFAAIPTTGGNTHIKLIAPVFNNFQSKIYIKSTGNTALTVLGFTGDNFKPISISLFPSLIKIDDLPLYNPIIGETTITVSESTIRYFYLTEPNLCKGLQLFGISNGVTYTIYLESTTNTPPITIRENETFAIDLKQIRLTKLIISANASGSFIIRELRS